MGGAAGGVSGTGASGEPAPAVRGLRPQAAPLRAPVASRGAVGGAVLQDGAEPPRARAAGRGGGGRGQGEEGLAVSIRAAVLLIVGVWAAAIAAGLLIL